MDESLVVFIDEKRPINPERKEGQGITATEYGKARGLDQSQASKILSELEKGGILKSQKMRWLGKQVRVYERADGKRTKP